MLRSLPKETFKCVDHYKLGQSQRNQSSTDGWNNDFMYTYCLIFLSSVLLITFCSLFEIFNQLKRLFARWNALHLHDLHSFHTLFALIMHWYLILCLFFLSTGKVHVLDYRLISLIYMGYSKNTDLITVRSTAYLPGFFLCPRRWNRPKSFSKFGFCPGIYRWNCCAFIA